MLRSNAFASGTRCTDGVTGSCEWNALFKYDDVDVAGLAMATSYGGGGGSRLRRYGFIGLATAGEMGDMSGRGPKPFMLGKLSILLLDAGPRATELGPTDAGRDIGPAFATGVCCGTGVFGLPLVLLLMLLLLTLLLLLLLAFLALLLLLLLLFCCCCCCCCCHDGL